MAILDQILSSGVGNGGFQFHPLQAARPPFQLPQAPASAGMNPQDPAKTMMVAQQPQAQAAHGGPDFDKLGARGQDWLNTLGSNAQDLLRGNRGGGPGRGGPPAPVDMTSTAVANPSTSGIMNSIMKAFNGGAGGGMDMAKLLALAGA